MKTIQKIGYSVLVISMLTILTGCPANHFQQGLTLMQAGQTDAAIETVLPIIDQGDPLTFFGTALSGFLFKPDRSSYSLASVLIVLLDTAIGKLNSIVFPAAVFTR